VLGGLILNAMPCVLPVLSLKLLAVAAHAGEGRRRVRAGLLATAVGVLLSFAILAASLVGLQAAGAAIGWGIQFQQPWFLAAMAALTALFAASLWDLLPIGLPGLSAVASIQSRRPLLDALLTGAFVTLLATPCSAPFVGTAVGFALSRGPGQIAAVFAALGLGMAAPYLLVAAAPSLVRLLPRPGAWMVWLRRAMGVLLAATAAWLLSVLALVADPWASLFAAVALLTALGLLAWRSREAGRTPGVGFAAAIATALAVLIPTLAALAAPSPRPDVGVTRWQAFDPDGIPDLVARGDIVFVDVTAAWCLTCTVNALAVLDRDPLAARLHGAGAVAMRADWTRPDSSITAYLARFGRFGVPLDVVYGPGRPGGVALPELLTTGAVADALRRAAGPPPGRVAER
jgi:suppressor for copper-sensitivity B